MGTYKIFHNLYYKNAFTKTSIPPAIERSEFVRSIEASGLSEIVEKFNKTRNFQRKIEPGDLILDPFGLVCIVGKDRFFNLQEYDNYVNTKTNIYVVVVRAEIRAEVTLTDENRLSAFNTAVKAVRDSLSNTALKGYEIVHISAELVK